MLQLPVWYSSLICGSEIVLCDVVILMLDVTSGGGGGGGGRKGNYPLSYVTLPLDVAM